MVYGFLRDFWCDTGSVPCGYRFPIHKGRCRDDSHWGNVFEGKRHFHHVLWILYGVFLPVPCFRKRQRGIYPRSLQAGNLLYPRYPASPDCLGAKWNFICPTDCRCTFRSHNGIHGDSASQKAE